MKSYIKKITVLFLVTCNFSYVNADTSPTEDSMFYYKLGGGRAFRSVPRWETTKILLSARLSVTGLSCGGFDPNVTIANTLNNVKDGLEESYVQLENAATAAISNLPGYILSKVNPNLYDLFMNSIAKAEVGFDLATKSCELIEAELRNGTDPFEEFATVSAGDSWKAGVGINGVDIEDVATAAEFAGENGISHPCHGRAGGHMQPSYLLLGDAATVGYNRLLERDKCDTSTMAVTSSVTPLVKKFNSPEKVREWVNVVVGEVDVDTSATGDPTSTPGAGILPLINQRKTVVYNDMVDMYEGTKAMTIPNLSAISAPGVLITAKVITDLRLLSPREAQIFLDRISDEVAIADLIDSALLIRRTLVTGKKETEFFATAPVGKHVLNAINEIDNEIDLIMKESEMRKRLMGESVPLLFDMARAKSNASLQNGYQSPERGEQLIDGRVKH